MINNEPEPIGNGMSKRSRSYALFAHSAGRPGSPESMMECSIVTGVVTSDARALLLQTVGLIAPVDLRTETDPSPVQAQYATDCVLRRTFG